MLDVVTTAASVYGAIGAAVALAFLLYGIDKVDAAAHGAYAVRPLLLPGLLLLWPIVIWRWIALARGEDPA